MAKMWITVTVCYTLSIVASASAVSTPPGIFHQPSKTIFYKAAETVTLPCEASGDPMPSYRWRKNEVDFNVTDNDARTVQLSGVGTLVINVAGGEDEAIYQCLAFNDFGTSVSVTVNLREARLMPFPVQKPKTYTPRLARPYTLDCIPPESVPKPSVFWVTTDLHGNVSRINYDARVSIDRQYRLRFAHITPGDKMEGKAYACMAYNQYTRESYLGPLHFMEPRGQMGFTKVDYLWADHSERFGLRGDAFSVKCIFSGNPTPEVHWERIDDKRMTSRHTLKSFSQELEITDLQPEDEGPYECYASNGGGVRKTRPFSIRVESRPYFLKEPEDLELSVGDSASFECIAAGKPNPEVFWYINGIPYENLRDERFVGRVKKQSNTKLYLSNVTQTDNMVVQCNATNLHGYVFADVYLNILQEGPSIQPGLDKLNEIVNLIVSFLWRLSRLFV